jgi:hypothetical protein
LRLIVRESLIAFDGKNYPSWADLPKVHAAAVQWAERIMRKIDNVFSVEGQKGGA